MATKRIRTTRQARDARAVVLARIDLRQSLADHLALRLARETCDNCGLSIADQLDPRTRWVQMRDHWKACV